MRFTPGELADQYAYAKNNGWLVSFAAAAKDYDWPVELVMAIASRETNMKNEVGDRGHGYGLMQVDVGTDPTFCHSGAWQDPHASIERGVQILESKRTLVGRGVGKAMSVGGYRFTGKAFASQDELNQVAVAAYNCGLWAYYCFSRGESVDKFDTGHDYSSDVLERAKTFAELIASDR
jgi:hypothetical protein